MESGPGKRGSQTECDVSKNLRRRSSGRRFLHGLFDTQGKPAAGVFRLSTKRALSVCLVASAPPLQVIACEQ